MSASIIIKECGSVILFIACAVGMTVNYFLPIRRMKKRANGNVLFLSETKFILGMGCVFLLCASNIIICFSENGFAYFIILALFPAFYLQGPVIVRSEKELFINGKTIQIADIVGIGYSKYSHKTQMTITIRNQNPITAKGTEEIKRFLNDLSFGGQAGI